MGVRLLGAVFCLCLSKGASSAPIVRDFPSGLHTAVVEDASIPLVAVDVCLLVGDADDPPEWPGLARLVGSIWEHSPTRHLVSGDHGRLLETAGLLPREPKVGVTRDRTHVTFVVPAHATELALWIAAERLGFLADGVDAHEISAALGVVKQQVDERATRAGGNIGDFVRRAVFGPAHPYGYAPPDASLGRVPAELVRDRLRSLYNAGNAYVTVLGSVPPGTARLVEKYFGPLAGTKVPAITPVKVTRVASELQVEAPYRQEVVEWATAPYTTRDDVSLDVLAQWLIVRLEERLVRRERLAVSVAARQESSHQHSMFWVSLSLADGAPAESALRAMDEELDAVRAGRVAPAEIAFAIRRMLVNSTRDEGVLFRARTTNAFLAYTGDVDGFTPYFAMYGATTPADLASAVARNLTPDTRVIAYIVPNPSAPKGGVARGLPSPRFQRPTGPPAVRTADASLWYRPPGTLSPQSFSPQTPALRTLPDGTRIAVAARDTGPVVHFRVSLPWMTRPPSPQTEWLVSQLVGGMDVDGESLHTRLSLLGASLKVGWSLDFLDVDVGVVTDALGEALHAVFVALDAAKFSSEGFQKLKDNQLKFLSQRDTEPTRRAWQAMARRVYVGAHRYHRDQATAERDLRALERPALERYLREQISRAPLAVSFVGDLDADTAERAVAAARKNGGRGPRRMPSRKAGELARGAQLEEDPEAKQTSILVFCPIPAYGQPEVAIAGGLRWTVGAPYTPSLAQRFAKEKVHTDKAETNVDMRQGSSIVFAHVIVPSAQGPAALRAVLDQFFEMAEKGPGLESFALARREQMDFMTSWYDSIDSELRLVSNVAAGDMDASAPILMYRHAQAMTATDIQGLAKGCVPNLRVVAVGQVKEIALELEKRKFGPISTFSAPVPR